MRIRVTGVLELLVAGETEESILEDYPYLEREDIRIARAAHVTGTSLDRMAFRAIRGGPDPLPVNATCCKLSRCCGI